MIGIIINWILSEIIIPLIKKAEDDLKLQDIKKSCHDSIVELEDAQDKKSIDSAIDKLP